MPGDGNDFFNDVEKIVYAGECNYCPQGHAHRFKNKGKRFHVFRGKRLLTLVSS